MSYLPVKFVCFLKSRLVFNIFYCFLMFINKHFIYLGCASLKNEWCYYTKPSAYYFYMRTKISEDFQICISVPLTLSWRSPISYRNQSIDLRSKIHKNCTYRLFCKHNWTFYYYILDLTFDYKLCKICGIPQM